ncbi:hypothetical protein [Leptolyngbya subtilissima]|uniref:Uncharacterized protein n=2 Tax=Cyanophyceae TaxID=3028117 RepID=A0ABV0KAH3_9CYAN|nr:hypothetical protein [Nodosilinea sp. FACHB-141]
MPSNSMKKYFSVLFRLIACIFAILILPLGNVALAQSIFEDGMDIGLTSFYTDASGQESKVKVLKDILDYDISVPLNVRDLNPTQVGNGKFQGADLDFSTAEPKIPGTATRIQFSGPVTSENGQNKTGFIYSVVGGKTKESSCPVEIKDTQIAFFETASEAEQAAKSLENKGYLVYVSVNSEAQDKAIEKIKELNCRPNAEGIVVNGKTQQVTVDFTKVFNLLPPRLQQAAREQPFVYFPKGDAIYLVNARKTYGITDLEVGLFDADTDELITIIDDNDIIRASDIANRNVTIAAVVTPDSAFKNKVGSIVFNLNNAQLTKTENISPYAIFGDDPTGNLNGGNLNLKQENTIFLKVYESRQAKGNLLGEAKVNFKVNNN